MNIKSDRRDIWITTANRWLTYYATTSTDDDKRVEDPQENVTLQYALLLYSKTRQKKIKGDPNYYELIEDCVRKIFSAMGENCKCKVCRETNILILKCHWR
jgi:hypothetical protein